MFSINQSWSRLVIKVGSALIAPEGRKCSTRYLLSIAEYIHHCLQQNKQIILVSSGSVAAGRGILNLTNESLNSVSDKQALAALGQSQVIAHWQKLIDHHCAQILLTRSDLESRQRSFHIKNTLDRLIGFAALPIINENDSVAIDELIVGDNDNLAAQVAVLAKADRLIICSDVDGLFNKDPRRNKKAKLITEIDEINDSIISLASDTNNYFATGGMKTKLQAALFATKAGIETLIVNGQKAEVFERLKRNQLLGTYFSPCQQSNSPQENFILAEGGE